MFTYIIRFNVGELCVGADFCITKIDDICSLLFSFRGLI